MFYRKILKYLQTFKISWQAALVYRLSFFVWRLRRQILLISKYVIWHALYQYNTQIGFYNQKEMLTYIIGVSLISNFIFTSKSNQVAEDISNGNLNNLLIKPLNYFSWIFSLDFGDKLANSSFLFFELLIFFLLFKPPFFWQKNLIVLITFFIFLLLAILIYFYLSFLISLLSFWYPEHSGWPARFIFSIITNFLSGSFLPLDIMPPFLYHLIKFLPTTYLAFFPLKIYLNKIDFLELRLVFLKMLVWIFLLAFACLFLWRKGVKNYSATGI